MADSASPMKILTVYSDSDEEKEDDASPLGAEPAAPRKRQNSDWASDEEAGNLASDAEQLVEPPPPARPDDFENSSPSPSLNRSPTPAASIGSASKHGSAPKFPRIDSQSLVSYGPDEEDLDESNPEKRRKSKASSEENQIKHIPDPETVQNEARTASSTPATIEDVDSYALLESCLEKQTESAPSPDPDFLNLPEEPKIECSQELKTRFCEHFKQKFSRNIDFNLAIQRRTDFRNPSIYEKLIKHFEIKECGSNFRPDIYDPHGFKPADFYEEISKAQRVLMDKMEKEKPPAPKDGTVSVPVSSLEDKRRKSKWDNPGAGGGSGPAKPALPASAADQKSKN